MTDLFLTPEEIYEPFRLGRVFKFTGEIKEIIDNAKKERAWSDESFFIKDGEYLVQFVCVYSTSQLQSIIGIKITESRIKKSLH